MRILVSLLIFTIVQAVVQAAVQQACAVSPQTEFMRSFRSERILFPDENSEFSQPVRGRDPAAMRWLLQKILPWNPTGGPKNKSSIYSSQCTPALWAKGLVGKKVRVQSEHIREYLSKCRGELETGVTQEWIHALKIMSIELDLDNHPFLHRVVFRLPNGDLLKGKLALKGDLKKRPLVIFRLGVYGTSEEFKPERFIFMMLFDQTPFNVLVLDNTTGPDYLAKNSTPALGGYSEGLQNMWVAKTLNDPLEPLSQLVSSTHLVGMSLGGHGVLFASLLNEWNRNEAGARLVSSFFGFCPVVHLRPNLEHLMESGFFGMAVDFWSRYRLQSMSNIKEGPYSADPELFSWDWLSWLRLKPSFLARVLQQVEKTLPLQGEKALGLRRPAGMAKLNSFWGVQDFWPYYRDVQAPVMVWANRHDKLVSWAENSGQLQEPNIGVVEFPEGHHCTLPIGYDWSALSLLFRTALLSQEFPLAMESETLQLDLSPDYDSRAESWFIDGVEWSGAQGAEIDLHLRHRWEPRQEMHALISSQKIDFRFRNSVRSEVERKMVERWVHQNVTFFNRADSRSLWLQWSHRP